MKNATDCAFAGDVISGTKHQYAIYEDDGSVRNTFLDVIPGTPVSGTFRRNPASGSSVYRDPTTNQVLGGRQFQESKNIPNGTAATFSARSTPNRGLYLLVTSSGAYAILAVSGTAIPIVIAKSIDVSVGATDPGTAAAFSVYPVSASAIAVTNRIGAVHNVTLLSLSSN